MNETDPSVEVNFCLLSWADEDQTSSPRLACREAPRRSDRLGSRQSAPAFGRRSGLRDSDG